MGRFDELSDVGRVLQSVIEANVPVGTDVRIAAPLDDTGGAGGAVRITLLWTTPQPAHRNDPDERNPDGSIAVPMPSLSVFFLVTTYGSTTEGDAIGAHNLLGRIIRAFHVAQQLDLPVDGFGAGRLSVIQLTIEPEFVEKVYTPLQVRLRPWAVFEVAPVQLIRTEAPLPPEPVVRPGGVTLAPIDVITPPRIARVTPARVGGSGRIRIDAAYTGQPVYVGVAGERIVSPAISALAPEGPVRANLPAAVVPGTYDLTLAAANDVASQPVTLTVLAASLPSVFAPDTLEHSLSGDLVLNAANLGANGTALAVFFWPDGGVQAPSEVAEAQGVVQAGGSELLVTAAELAGVPPGLHRISVRTASHVYTAFVLLEVTP